MTNRQLTLQESLKLLEIINLDRIKEEDLIHIRRKAQKRWHPDTIAYTKPPPETVKRYERNFALIDVAVAIVGAYLKGNLHPTTQSPKNYKTTHSVPPEEIIRQNASTMQETLRSHWNKIKKIRYKFYEETVILSEGFRLKDLLKQDLRDNVPVICIVSLLSGAIFFLIIMTLLAFLTDESPFVMSSVYGIWGIQALSCVVGFLPLSRFWLPIKVSNFIAFFINLGIFFQLGVAKLTPRCGCLLMIAIPMLITIYLAYIVKWVVLLPLYGLSGFILGDHRIGKIEKKKRYYAGLADWYIEELINGNPGKFTAQQLFDLSHLYSELKDVKYA
jgi:hypothetical protein